MQHVPEDIQEFYRVSLSSSIEKNKHYNFLKWLGYYLDFCHRYRFAPYERDSFSHFSQKLNDKGQSLESIEEAFQAIELLLPYYKSGLKEGELESSTEVIQQLISILRQRNYSPRTVEAYTKWSRSFLSFYTGVIKDISEGDARQFLNHLVTVK